MLNNLTVLAAGVLVKSKTISMSKVIKLMCHAHFKRPLGANIE